MSTLWTSPRRLGAWFVVILVLAAAVLAGVDAASAFPARGKPPAVRAQSANASLTRVVSVVTRAIRRAALASRRRLQPPPKPRTPVPSPVAPAPGQPPPSQPPPSQPPPAPPAPGLPAQPAGGRVGVGGPLVWYSNEEQLAYLRRAKENGLTWARQDFFWGVFEQSPGVWKFEVGDRLMRNASIAGVDILAGITYSAQWAASGPTIYHPPKDPAAFANFCRVVVERYGPGGTFWAQNPGLTPRPVTAVEIWNEPWLHFFWRPNPDPAAYARLLRVSAEAVRAANPDVKILASGDVFQMRTDTTASLDWFKPLVAIDPQLFRTLVDAYSIHLYTQDRAPFEMWPEQRWRFDRALITRDVAAAAGASHPLWVTEFGWSTFVGHPDSVSEAEQALFVRQALEKTLGDWSSFVERSFIYYWGKAPLDYNGGYSPLRPDGTEKPVLATLRALASPS